MATLISLVLLPFKLIWFLILIPFKILIALSVGAIFAIGLFFVTIGLFISLVLGWTFIGIIIGLIGLGLMSNICKRSC